GPQIVITFQTAQGLEVGKTQVRYKDVTVGTVSRIELSEDWAAVEITADIDKHAEELASQGAKFWVVRPRMSFSGVSGLGTLLSGAYIEADVPAGAVEGSLPTQTQFRGLESPPEITTDRSGSHFMLDADNLGSLDLGSPVYFRYIKVGQVVGYQLDPTGSDVDIQIFVEAPYDRFVTTSARFWDASGIDLTLGANGLTLRTQSLLSIALGGVAFEPFGDEDEARADNNTTFPLYTSETAARAVPDSVVLPVRMRFDQSIRGLAVGAEVDFKGLKLGEVTAIALDYDLEKRSFYAVVDANLYPRRLGPVYETADRYARDELHARNLFEPMIENGLRAQLRTSNLLTGQLYVVIDTFPDAKPVVLDEGNTFILPTIPGELTQLQQRLSGILTKIEAFPIDQIGQSAQRLLTETTRMIQHLDKQVTPEAQAMLRQGTQALVEIQRLLATDAPLMTNSEQALQEMTRAARSLRNLADYLQTHPDALIRGR
ncbi:MAG: intermembrane transport protein PqiB, partial [Pigmentiphaga sp.]